MAIPVNINGVIIPYPQTGDVGWGANATKFAEEVASVLAKIGQSQAPVNNDIIVSPGNLSVTSGNLSVTSGNLSVTSGNISVGGNASVTGNILLSSLILNSNGRSILNQSGSILQVLTNSTSGGSNTTSTSFVDVANFTVTITPSSTSSRILVIASSILANSLVAATNIIYYQRLVGNGVELQQNYISAESAAGGLQAKGNLSISCVHSPLTTSPVTYKIQHYVSTSSSTGSCSSGFIIAMEISG